MIARRFALAAFVWCALVGVALALVPGSRSTSCSATTDSPEMVCTSSSQSLVESQGAGVLIVLAVPAIATGLPLVIRHRAVAIAGAVVLTILGFLGMASIGMFFLPAVGLAWCAVATRTKEPAPATW